MSTTRTEFTQKMKRQLNALNTNMAVLDSKASEAKADAQVKYEAEIEHLRHQSKLAVARLEEISSAGEDGWDQMAAEMEKLRDAFIHSFHYLKSQA